MTLISDSYNIQWQILFSDYVSCSLGCRLGALPNNDTFSARRAAERSQKHSLADKQG